MLNFKRFFLALLCLTTFGHTSLRSSHQDIMAQAHHIIADKALTSRARYELLINLQVKLDEELQKLRSAGHALEGEMNENTLKFEMSEALSLAWQELSLADRAAIFYNTNSKLINRLVLLGAVATPLAVFGVKKVNQHLEAKKDAVREKEAEALKCEKAGVRKKIQDLNDIVQWYNEHVSIKARIQVPAEEATLNELKQCHQRFVAAVAHFEKDEDLAKKRAVHFANIEYRPLVKQFTVLQQVAGFLSDSSSVSPLISKEATVEDIKAAYSNLAQQIKKLETEVKSNLAGNEQKVITELMLALLKTNDTYKEKSFGKGTKDSQGREYQDGDVIATHTFGNFTYDVKVFKTDPGNNDSGFTAKRVVEGVRLTADNLLQRLLFGPLRLVLRSIEDENKRKEVAKLAFFQRFKGAVKGGDIVRTSTECTVTSQLFEELKDLCGGDFSD